MDKECIECGNVFKVEKFRFSSAKFCSRKCYFSIGHRIKSGVEKSKSGCWNWIKSKTSDGYGALVATVRGKKEQRAHRISWIHFNGDIPKLIQVLHKCDNPLCVNPEHLFLGTPLENMLDKTKKKRNNATKGEDSPVSKLSLKQVLEIRRLHSAGITQRKIADKFSVGYKAVNKIVLRKRWDHV